MGIFKRLCIVILLLTAIFSSTAIFMYVLDLYPDNCNYMPKPLKNNCIKFANNNITFERITNPYTIYFNVKVPSETPYDDTVYLETSAGSIKMEKIGENLWGVELSRGGTLNYRYTRNNLGYATAEEFEDDAEKFRAIEIEKIPKKQEDVVKKWRYLSERKLENINIDFVNIKPREFYKGISIIENFEIDAPDVLTRTFQEIKSIGAEWVMLSSNCAYLQTEPEPRMSRITLNKSKKLKDNIALAKRAGLKVVLKIKLCCNSPPDKKYSDEWWNDWFNETENVLIDYANVANQNYVEGILIDYTFGNSMPGSAWRPKDSEDKWAKILDKINEDYSGKIGLNTFIIGEYKEWIYPWPQAGNRFVNSVDFYFVEIWAAVGNETSTLSDIKNGAGIILNRMVEDLTRLNKPVIIVIAYPSVSGAYLGDTGVNPTTSGLYPWEKKNKNLTFNGVEQANVYNAFLEAVAENDKISGVFSYGYFYDSAPDSLDYSIRGKEAESVVKEWFRRF